MTVDQRKPDLRNLVLFWVWEDAGCGLPEVLPFICTPALGQPPGLSHPQGSGTGEGLQTEGRWKAGRWCFLRALGWGGCRGW